ncbi:MAG TPA: adenine phosphoribosyltransferase [Cyanobacteria bacterium UBA8530]|nr:adenine phosphoribosyltransferase [Cyanobacteria bacterium UBA8530]
MITSDVASILKGKIRDIPNFPKEGILFRDLTPLLKDPETFDLAIRQFVERFQGLEIDYVVGVESRGFILGAPIAQGLKAGFIPVRKPGKLPYLTNRAEYQLEYGTDALEIHQDAVEPGKRVLIVDDLLATGGTISATVDLVKRCGGEVTGVAFLVELTALGGRDKLSDLDVFSLILY